MVSGADLGLYVERPDQLLRVRVADTLREAILHGALAPGQRLTERELGEQTGVSRTSLREALRQLQAEGLVEPSEARGLRVALLTEPVVTQLYDVRAILESAAVEMFTRNASDQQVSALLEAAPRGLPASDDLEERLAEMRGFYEVLLKGTQNAVLQQMFASVEARIRSLRRLSLQTQGREAESRAEFAEMIHWISRRDTVRAANATRVHVMAAKVAALAATRKLNTRTS